MTILLSFISIIAVAAALCLYRKNETLQRKLDSVISDNINYQLGLEKLSKDLAEATAKPKRAPRKTAAKKAAPKTKK